MSVEFEEINKQREANDENLVMVDFTDEEGYGKYLDLHECYNKYLNIKGNVSLLDVYKAYTISDMDVMTSLVFHKFWNKYSGPKG